jgi:hypothetical protein
MSSHGQLRNRRRVLGMAITAGWAVLASCFCVVACKRVKDASSIARACSALFSQTCTVCRAPVPLATPTHSPTRVAKRHALSASRTVSAATAVTTSAASAGEGASTCLSSLCSTAPSSRSVSATSVPLPLPISWSCPRTRTAAAMACWTPSRSARRIARIPISPTSRSSSSRLSWRWCVSVSRDTLWPGWANSTPTPKSSSQT